MQVHGRCRTVREREGAKRRQLRACQSTIVYNKAASINNGSSYLCVETGEFVSSIGIKKEVEIGAYLKTKAKEQRVDESVDHLD